MSEEYITDQGFSSLDIETCDECHRCWYYEEVTEYRGEKICKSCMEEIKADIIRDERKDNG